jgi:hypothetical protein
LRLEFLKILGEKLDFGLVVLQLNKLSVKYGFHSDCRSMNEPILNQFHYKIVSVIIFETLEEKILFGLFFSGSILINKPLDISNASHRNLVNFDVLHAPV